MRHTLLWAILGVCWSPCALAATAVEETGPAGEAWIELGQDGSLQRVVWGESLQRESDAVRRAMQARLAGVDWRLGAAAVGAQRVGTTVKLETRFDLSGERAVLHLDPIYAGIGYRLAPPPRYPTGSLRNLDQADVLVRVAVDAEGKVAINDLQIKAKFPGDFERSVRDSLSRWRLLPEQLDGRPVAGERWVSIRFSLHCSRGDRDFAFHPEALPGVVDVPAEAQLVDLIEITATRGGGAGKQPRDCGSD